MTFYTPSVAVDPISAPSVISQPASQALMLANQGAGMHYPTTIPTGRNSYAYGSYMQPQYGYQQSMPVYVQPQQQVVYANGYPAYSSQGYGYGGMPMTQYMPGMGMGGARVIVQDPYGGYRKHRSRRHRRHSHSGYYY